MGFLETDGVLHTVAHRATCNSSAAVIACPTLLLAVPSPVTGIKKVGDAGVHQRIDLLHATLLAVVVEVAPRHTCHRTVPGDTSSKFTTNDTATHYGTQVFIVGHPIRLHVLNTVAVRQHHLVELRGV